MCLAVPDLHCGIRDLSLWHANSQLQHVGSSSLNRDPAQPSVWGVWSFLATGPPSKSLYISFLKKCIYFIKIQLIYNVVFISTLQQCDSVTDTHSHTYTHIYILFHILFHYGLSQAIKNTVLYSKTLLLIHSIYNSLPLLMPNSHPLQSLFCWGFFFTSLWGRQYLSSCTRVPISPATKVRCLGRGHWDGEYM